MFRHKTAFGVTCVIIATVVLHYVGALKVPERGIRKIMNGGMRSVYQSVVVGPDALNASNGQGSCIADEQAAVALALLKEENETLRRQLGFVSRGNRRFVSAEVIGRNVEPTGNTLIIHRGAKDGIKVSAAVMVDDGVLIGKIARVESDVSIVQLLSDGESRVAATVMNLDRSIGIVEGGYGISVRMTFIPQHEAVRPGDIVITSGLEKGVPKGLMIGTVEAVEKEAYQPFQRAVLSPRAKLDRVSLVTVLLPDETSAL